MKKSAPTAATAVRLQRVLFGMLALPLLAMSTACSYVEVDIQSEAQSWTRMNRGHGAVVCARAEPHPEPRCVLIFYGDVGTPNPGARLAERLTDVARGQMMWEVLDTKKVARTLIRDGRRQPLPDKLPSGIELARALDCDWFLTCDVEVWHTRYILLQSWSTIKFEVVCMYRAGMLPASERVAWRAQVRCRMRDADDAEVAERAVRALFDRIRKEVWE